jgi:prepilin-type N-terminal cleavage/methylation domain-containing protein
VLKVRRRGFSLVELVVALTLALIVTGAIHRLVFSSQRLSRMQASQIDLQTNVRAAGIVIANEVRELNAVGGGSVEQTDVLNTTPSGLTYRATRGIGFLCEASLAGRLRIARATFSGFRDPQALRDGAYLLIEGNPAAGIDDVWLQLSILSITTNTVCGGAPAIDLTVSPATTAGLPAGTPVRFFEPMELKLYQSGGNAWLGARSIATGEAIQPVTGPLAATDGLQLEYLDRNSAPTADPASIRSIVLRIRGISEDPVFTADGTPLEETLVGQVTLRNGSRP